MDFLDNERMEWIIDSEVKSKLLWMDISKLLSYLLVTMIIWLGNYMLIKRNHQIFNTLMIVTLGICMVDEVIAIMVVELYALGMIGYMALKISGGYILLCLPLCFGLYIFIFETVVEIDIYNVSMMDINYYHYFRSLDIHTIWTSILFNVIAYVYLYLKRVKNAKISPKNSKPSLPQNATNLEVPSNQTPVHSRQNIVSNTQTPSTIGQNSLSSNHTSSNVSLSAVSISQIPSTIRQNAIVSNQSPPIGRYNSDYDRYEDHRLLPPPQNPKITHTERIEPTKKKPLNSTEEIDVPTNSQIRSELENVTKNQELTIPFRYEEHVQQAPPVNSLVDKEKHILVFDKKPLTIQDSPASKLVEKRKNIEKDNTNPSKKRKLRTRKDQLPITSDQMDSDIDSHLPKPDDPMDSNINILNNKSSKKRPYVDVLNRSRRGDRPAKRIRVDNKKSCIEEYRLEKHGEK